MLSRVVPQDPKIDMIWGNDWQSYREFGRARRARKIEKHWLSLNNFEWVGE